MLQPALLLLSAAATAAAIKQMTVAAIFDEGGDRQHELAFKSAVKGVNMRR